MAEEAKWYVAHTYSGYEDKVKANIEKSVENRGMQDLIHEVVVPKEEVIEEKNGVKKPTFKKIFPSYVVVKMVMTDESWYVVRNTRGVTGFVGPGSKPVPLSPSEVARMGIDKTLTMDIKFKVDDYVTIKSGPMEGFSGKVVGVDTETGRLEVMVSMFNRETKVEIDQSQVEAAE